MKTKSIYKYTLILTKYNWKYQGQVYKCVKLRKIYSIGEIYNEL